MHWMTSERKKEETRKSVVIEWLKTSFNWNAFWMQLGCRRKKIGWGGVIEFKALWETILIENVPFRSVPVYYIFRWFGVKLRIMFNEHRSHTSFDAWNLMKNVAAPHQHIEIMGEPESGVYRCPATTTRRDSFTFLCWSERKWIVHSFAVFCT